MFWWFQTPLSLPHLDYWFTHPKGPPKVVFNIKTTTHETLFLTCLLNFNGKLRLVFKKSLGITWTEDDQNRLYSITILFVDTEKGHLVLEIVSVLAQCW